MLSQQVIENIGSVVFSGMPYTLQGIQLAKGSCFEKSKLLEHSLHFIENYHPAQWFLNQGGVIMNDDLIHYEFVNAQTDNVIAYLSLPATMSEEERRKQLEKKRSELAMTNGLFFEDIYWRDHDHAI